MPQELRKSTGYKEHVDVDLVALNSNEELGFVDESQEGYVCNRNASSRVMVSDDGEPWEVVFRCKGKEITMANGVSYTPSKDKMCSVWTRVRIEGEVERPIERALDA